MSHAWKTTVAPLAIFISLTLASAAVAEAPSVQAAEPNAPRLERPMASERGPGDLLARLTKLLQLTPEQQDQAKSIMASAQSQMKEMMADSSLSPEERHQRKQQVHDDAMEKFNAILTPEQQETFEKFQKEHPFDHGMADHGPGEMRDMMGEISDALKLTPDQQIKMKKIFTDFHPQIESVQADQTLSPADRKARLEDIHHRMHDTFRGILTPEQQKTFDQMHPE